MNTPPAYIVIAHHHVREGNGDTVAAALIEHRVATLAEAGCLDFTAQRSITDPDSFAMVETYRSQADWDAHQQTPHYQKYVVGIIKPLLARREVDFYHLVTGPELE